MANAMQPVLRLAPAVRTVLAGVGCVRLEAAWARARGLWSGHLRMCRNGNPSVPPAQEAAAPGKQPRIRNRVPPSLRDKPRLGKLLAWNRTMRRIAFLVVLAFGMAGQPAMPQAPEPLGLDDENAAMEAVLETSIPLLLSDVSPNATDASLVLRFTMLLFNGWFDATAPYHPVAVGVYSRLARRPLAEATPRNLNIAILHASFRILSSLLPQRAPDWRQLLHGFGLDPDDASTDTTKPEGIGNVAGARVVEGRVNDGMNQLGNEIRREYNKRPYFDYTSYEPVNTAYDLFDPSRWQPGIQRSFSGLFKVQNFVTPQYGLVEPYSYQRPEQYSVVPPADSDHRSLGLYKDQADEVLTASAALSEERKLLAELFDNKVQSLLGATLSAAESRELSALERVHLLFATHMAAFDAGILAWKEKRRHDAVRPFSAIRQVYGNDAVLAWGGPGEATVSMPASDWRSYLEAASHPEYPSASACVCAAVAQAARMFLKDDDLGFSVHFPSGSSVIEPGFTPRGDTTLTIPTWTDFSSQCGKSRLWGGVSFRAAIEESQAVCGVFGELAHSYAMSLMSGTAARRAPSGGR